MGEELVKKPVVNGSIRTDELRTMVNIEQASADELPSPPLATGRKVVQESTPQAEKPEVKYESTKKSETYYLRAIAGKETRSTIKLTVS